MGSTCFASATLSGIVLPVTLSGAWLSTRAKLNGPHRVHVQKTGFISSFIFPSRGTNGTYGLINVTSKRASRQNVSSFVIEFPKNVPT